MEVWDAAPAYSQQLMTGVRAFKLYKASSGTIGVTTSWALIDSAYTISLPAQIGDVIEMGFDARWSPAGAASLYMDYEIGGVRQGDPSAGSWAGTFNAGWHAPINIHWLHTILGGDISGGLVTVKPWGNGQSAQNFGITPRPVWWAKNLGMAA